MATLQKIRSNKITQIAIGLAMFCFIITSFFTCMKQNGPDRTVATFDGKKLDIVELNKRTDEYKEFLQVIGQIPQGEQVSNEMMTQIREGVYQDYIRQQMLEDECEKLGITVTDTELQHIIKTGNSQWLMQLPYFRTQQGTFDFAALQQFLKQHKEIMSNPQADAQNREMAEMIYRTWCFTEKKVKENALMEKYQMLLSGLLVSNTVSAKANFEARTNETDIVLAALPFTSIADNDVKVDDSELKAKYDEYKERFYDIQETRDIKYIDVTIKASKADEEAINKEMAEFAAALKDSSTTVDAVVRRSQSTIPYCNVPVSSKIFPRDIAAQIDSMAVGTQCEPYYSLADNTMNIVKLMGKVSRPDSVEFRQIVAANQAQDMAAAKKTADSIYNALQNGANFDTIAKAYNQPATKQWITGQMYEGATLDDNNKKLIETITTSAVGSLNKVELDGAVLLIEVTDRRQMVDKYDVAVIKRPVNFSNETSNNAYNDLSSFIATNKTREAIEKNQTSAYTLIDRTDVEAMTPALMGIEDSREVIRWMYNEDTKLNDVSEIFYCGKHREHLVVAVLTGIHPVGYRSMENENVANEVKRLVIEDKKAAQLQEKMKSAKSVADVTKIAGAVQDSIQHITFAAAPYLQRMGGVNESVISGAASAAAQGKFVSGVRGKAGVYAFQVLAKNKTEEKYDEKAEMQRATQQNMYMIRSMFQADMRAPFSIFYNKYKNTSKEDKRHLFF